MQKSNLIDVVRARLAQTPERVAFTFLDYHPRTGQRISTSWTMYELDARARSVAAELDRLGARGERALLLYRAGLDFVAGFLGCLYAGVVAVPASVPKQGWGADRVRTIAAHSGARFALSTASSLRATSQFLTGRDDLQWLLTDEIAPAARDTAFIPAAMQREDLALLQYSSGSTGNPKAVMITHDNLLSQALLVRDAFALTEDDCSVSWLPNYHDMGLITSVVLPLFTGFHCALMAPEAFVMKPSRWLQELSERRVRCCVAPDFAYELCTRRISDDELRALDLTAIEHAVNGAEPVRARTLARFTERFEPCGFDGDAFKPVYGLAEATLMVSGRSSKLVIGSFEREPQDRRERSATDAADSTAIRLVSCGRAYGDNDIRIVDPESRRELPALHTGEIWVRGGSVGRGYWGDVGASNDNFSAMLADSDGTRFMRTGDLGFFQDGELFIRGRLKDLILIRGSNHHAPDIEQTVEACHPALAVSSGAAFSVDIDDEERLIIVHELERDGRGIPEAQLAEIATTIRRCVTEQHQIAPHAVLLLGRGLPKTTSGKVRRDECRSRFLAGQLKTAYAWTASQSDDAPTKTGAAEAGSERQQQKTTQCEQWLIDRIARASGTRSDRIGILTPVSEFDLSPAAMIELVRDFEREFGVLVTMSVFLEHENIQQLANHLGKAIAAADEAEPGTGGRLTAEALASSMGSEARSSAADAIAIVGMACRLPAANGTKAFWDNLCRGVDAVGEVPPERWDNEALYDENPLAQGKMNTRRGGFLTDVELFDRKFFGIPVREAVRMDPAHRLLLELSWETLEDAGIPAGSVSGQRVGVYIGISGSDYAQLQFGDEMLADAYAGVGCALTNSASRISHFLNLRGPALAVDTACSSSLSALHLAASAVRSGECQLALAGGVNIILSPTVTMSLSKAGMMAPDGRCKTFDKRADGYVRSEGAGLVLLKPLARAIADGDRIYAVIRGSASNQDGKSSGISAPNGEAQQRVVLAACENAGILPGNLDYVEAHGTGTALGDPIEVNALGEVLKIGAQPGKTYAIGSVKTNIGHTESAAGIASIIKASLILHHRQLPPSLNFEDPNPLIPFERYNISVQKTLQPLIGFGGPALVGVNSFGIGGTNVHFVLEEPGAMATSRPMQMNEERPYVLTISARSENSLKLNTAALLDYLSQEGTPSLGDIEYTLGARRSHLEHRLAVIGSDRAELITALKAQVEINYHADILQAHAQPGTDGRPKLAFVFSGQGPQWWAMGRKLFSCEPVFRDCIEQCDGFLKPMTGWSLIELLHADEAHSTLRETAYAQPALFALHCGLAALLRSLGIEPDAVVGHSLGEIAAAHIAGCLSLEDGCRLVAVRAELMQKATGEGLMASIEMSREDVERELAGVGDALTIAATNTHGTTVVSGERQALEALLASLKQRGVVAVQLPVNYAFHSAQMEPIKRELVLRLAGLSAKPARIPFMSTVTADWAGSDHLLGPEYWGANVRQEVRFGDAITALGRQGVRVYVEIGPTPVLFGAIVRGLKLAGIGGDAVTTLERDADDLRMLARCIGMLQTLRCSPDWTAWRPAARFVSGLPHYRWDRQRYWMDAAHHEARRRLSAHPLVSLRMPVAQPTWQSHLDINVDPYLTALRVRGRPRIACGVHVELALEALFGGSDQTSLRELFELQFDEVPDALDPTQLPTLQTTIHGTRAGASSVTISAQTDDSQGKAAAWFPVMTCRTAAASSTSTPRQLDIVSLRARFTNQLSATEVYRRLAEVGAEYAPPRQVVQEIWRDEEAVLIGLRTAQMFKADIGKYQLHPLVFEAIEQAARLTSGSVAAQHELAHVARVRLIGDCARATLLYARLRVVGAPSDPAREGESTHTDVWVLADDGSVLAIVEGIRFRAQRSEEDFSIPTDIDHWRYRVHWQERALEATDLAATPANGAWLIVADRRGVGEQLCRWLRQHGQDYVIVEPRSAFSILGTDHYEIDANSTADRVRVLREAFAERDRSCLGVVHLGALDAARGGLTPDIIAADQNAGALGAMFMVQAVAQSDFLRAPRLWLVTCGVHAVSGDAGPLSLSQAQLWGYAKAIVIEHAELRVARVDLSAAVEAEIAALGMEILADGSADQIALRVDRRYIAELKYERKPTGEEEPSIDADQAAAGVPYRLSFERQNGTIRRHKVRRSRPGSDEVELRLVTAQVAVCGSDLQVRACSGVLLRNGPGGAMEPGQQLVAIVRAPLASHLRVRASATAAIPTGLDAPSLVSVIQPLFAAWCALREIAGVGKGDRVLIRGESADTTLAAIQIARLLGARVFVSTPAALHPSLAGQRVELLFDETEPSSYISVRAMSNNIGVDVLVNLGGPLDTARCLLALRNFGRCIDLTADGDYRAAVAMMPNNATLQRLDIEGFLSDRPDEASRLLSEVVEHVRSGAIRVPPASGVVLDELAPALAEPIGASLLVQMPQPIEAGSDQLRSAYRSDASYLITGGLGGLGLKIAERMIDQGARSLVLCGRSPPNIAALDVLAEFEAKGARCTTIAVDVADSAQVSAMLDRIRHELPPLAGIVHAAGILDNGLITQMDERQFRSVMPAKVDGAWNLHIASTSDALDFFVMFSSLASIIGSPGQSNYAAANAFLEALAEQRRLDGRVGLAIGWGPWADVGMAADVHNLQRLEQHGMGMVSVEKGLDLLEELILEGSAGVVGALPMNWTVWGRTRAQAARTAYFAGLVPASAVVVSNVGKITAASLAGKEAETQVEMLQAAVLRALCQSMMLDADSVELNVPLTAIGLDSIVALELKDRIESAIDVTVRTSALIGGKSIRALAIHFRDELTGVAASANSESQNRDAELLDGLEELTQDEIESMLMDLETEAR